MLEMNVMEQNILQDKDNRQKMDGNHNRQIWFKKEFISS